MSDAIVVVPIFNESRHVNRLLEKIAALPADGPDWLFVDDASSDDTGDQIAAAGHSVIRHETRLGCGPSVRTGLQAGRERGYQVIAVMAGNGKDDPALVNRLIDPIRSGESDFVQGSRYLSGGSHSNMPLHRKLGTRGYSAAFSFLSGQTITDATNGFRAVRATLLDHPEIDLDQEWLRDYEVESYLFFKAIALGFRVTEAPVSKLYPETGPYTKMAPFKGWWSHFRPVLLLALGLKD